jgi:hypothetical protein
MRYSVMSAHPISGAQCCIAVEEAAEPLHK